MIKLKYLLFLIFFAQSYAPFASGMLTEFAFELDTIFDDNENTVDRYTDQKENESNITLDDISLESEELFIDSEDIRREVELHNNKPISPCEVVMLLTSSTIQAQVLLQEDLYKHTNPNNSRSLLNLPGFYHHYFKSQENYFWTQLFYNQTSNGYYTKESTQLQSYVALDNPNLIQVIEKQQFPRNVPSILSVFGNMKLQERRLGFMFGGQHIWHTWHVRAYAPLYYLERNVSLTDEEQQMLERLGLPAADDPMDFARKHLIVDKLGFGDSRIEVGYTAYKNDVLLGRVGGLFTIPTAFAFAKGLYGTHFSKNTPAPYFSLYKFISTIFPPIQDIKAATLQAEQFLIGAVDRLSTMVLETGLGNEGHFGIGIFTDSELKVSDSWTLRSKGSLEYLTPRTEERFYIMKKNPAEFDRNYTSTNLAVCEENLAFLNHQLIETLYPTMFKTRIHPGYIFMWNTSLTYQGNKIDCMFGYDLYWQDKEKLGRIRATHEQIARLRTDIAIKPGAYQTKLFGDLIYKKKGTYRDYHFGFHLDATLLSMGIGRDFTLALYFDTTI